MINPNTAFEEEIYYDYLRDPDSVTPEWRSYFSDKRNQLNRQIQKDSFILEKNSDKKITSDSTTDTQIGSDEIESLNSLQTKISENMELSLEIPTATSVRTIPVKALDENRRIINKYLIKQKRPRVSFTHVLSWAITQALIKYPRMNNSYVLQNGKAARINKSSINIGFAVDITKKDGTRMLLVPNIKNSEKLSFTEFINALDRIFNNSRNNQLDPSDLSGTTVTITNPGMIGTTASIPRLMTGQGLIIATGAIEYPSEFQAVRPEILTKMAISKVITITSTYDHRIIQGAESAEFLAYIHKLLIGEDRFYEQIFASLQIPFPPIKWEIDNSRVNRFGEYDEHEIIEKGAHVVLMINAFRVRGHLLASVNPLGLSSYFYPELDPAYYGFTIWDLDRIFHADDSWPNNNLSLRDIIEILRESYCANISIEFMHIQDPDKKDWVKKNVESTKFTYNFTYEEKLRILRKLIDAEEFENFLHTKYVGHKRFSLEGSESVIVMLDKIYELAADKKLNSVVLGMAHRGRLNVLVNITGKSVEKVFKEFEGEIDPDSYHGSGDVKYHLGDKGIFTAYNGNQINSILAPNPSHLELVDPIIEGMSKALNFEINDSTDSLNLPIIIHGDAAFAGQGIVAETLNFSQLAGYRTGGTIHIIINNQIGFTTNSLDARSTVYATDIAKMIQVPIIHVNGNDPEAVASAAIFAFEYRNKFNSDIIIDLLSYRKYGHNESDEPSYTQPLLYKKIKLLKPVGELYREELINTKTITAEFADSLVREVQEKLYNAFINRTVQKMLTETQVQKNESIFEFLFDSVNTNVHEGTLRFITDKITSYPQNLNVNPKLKQLLKKRAEMVASSKPEIDWAMAEALAFGSILLEGKNIRFTGQDSRRGTFSQRHAVITDIETEDQYVTLNHIREGQGVLSLYDSPLSELSILGFEYGYSIIANNSLVIWEAQFGDFANMAQAMIDQIIVGAESKWHQTSNLVMLLPHSYDGQGPEHSSARLERYLQLAAEDNIIVCNLTTPANYFHVLRRQAFMANKKPLVIMTPKGMLRHPMAVSSIIELSNENFEYIIDSYNGEVNQIEKLVFCTGKIYYEALAELKKKSINNINLVRVEQLYPLNQKQLSKILEKYSNTKKICWMQEEPKNMGAYNFIASYFLDNFDIKLKYFGRKASASTATGSYNQHLIEQQNIFNELISY